MQRHGASCSSFEMKQMRTGMASRSVQAFLMWFVSATLLVCSDGVPMKLDLVHKFSNKARETMKSRHGEDFVDWPAEGTAEYHDLLRDHDVARHRGTERILVSKSKQYTFARGNVTEQLFEGGLHYAFVDIGTPNVPFLVLLDTGSDLLWIPCECQQCAPLSAPSDDPRSSNLKAYSPTSSSSSKRVSCSDPLCINSDQCASPSNQCPYEIKYVSANTSTSGIMFQDSMYFIPEAGGSSVSLPIYLGCGQIQTGSLLNGAAADGLLGLGMQPLSVPSRLASTGVLPDSFSMCISPDKSGRIIFGDKGPAGQPSTAILPLAASGYRTYNVELDSIMVGSSLIPAGIQALFDTGTAFTYLATSLYTTFVQDYQQQMTLPQYTDQIWDLCFATSNPVQNVPKITFSFTGGSALDIYSGLIPVYDATPTLVAFCLTVLDSGSEVSIIGQNFMTNYSVTYNREANILGWTQSNCYTELTATTPATTTPPPALSGTPSPSVHPPATAPPPTGAATTPTPPAPRLKAPPSPPLTPAPPPPPSLPVLNAAATVTPSSSLVVSLSTLIICFSLLRK